MNIKEIRKFRWERSFSIVLAEEVIREEIKKILPNENISFIYFDTKSTSVKQITSSNTRTNDEGNQTTNERFVTVTSLFYASPKKIGNILFCELAVLYQADAEIRLYQVLTSNGRVWKCHFLDLKVSKNEKTIFKERLIYKDGVIESLYAPKQSINPCSNLENLQPRA